MLSGDRMNNKGFMMAEVVVVSSIILIFMTAMYTTYSGILSAYKERVTYYDVPLLYKLGYYRDSLNKNETLLNNYIEYLNTSLTTKVEASFIESNDRLLLLKNYEASTASNKTLSDAQVNEIKEIIENQTFKDYIDYMKTAVTFTQEYKYILILESCDSSNNKCSYAYLEYIKNSE